MAETIARRLILRLSEGVETAAGTLPTGLSAGFALVPEDAATLDLATKLADAALYAAKDAGKRTVRRAGQGLPPQRPCRRRRKGRTDCADQTDCAD